jgi:hypothetical protein
MDDAILNSLLRLSNQLTPVRETYPIPSRSFVSNLRTPAPAINLSTYYLMDWPASTARSNKSLLSKSPSTCAFSPQKRPNLSSSPKKKPETSTENSRRPTEPEIEIRKIVEKEKQERAKVGPFSKGVEKTVKKANRKESDEKVKEIDKTERRNKEQDESEEGGGNDNEVKKEFEEYKRNQSEVMKTMQTEIEALRRRLANANQFLSVPQPKS